MSSNSVKIKLGMTLTPAQREIDSSTARFKICKAGRRFGKTYYIACWLAKRALTFSGKHWYVTTTLGLAKDELFPAILAILPPECVLRVDERALTIIVTNGIFQSTITCKSAEKEQNLRGRGLVSVAVDEAAFLRPSIWPETLRPQLADSQGHALIFSSPKKGWFTRLWRQAKADMSGNMEAFHFTIYDNPKIKPEEIEDIRKTQPEHVWLQEYMAEEIARSGVVYDEFDPTTHVFNPAQRFTDAGRWRTVVGMDWGSHAETGVVWLPINPLGHIAAVREHAQKGWDVHRHAEIMHRLGSGLEVAPYDYVLDRSAFRQESTSSTSIADQFKKEDIHVSRSERDVNASIDIVKRYLRGSNRVPWLYISSDCQKLIEAIQEWEYDKHEPDILAAMRYGIMHAVRRRYTTLVESPAPIEKSIAAELNEEIKFSPTRLRLPSLSSPAPSQWTWDYDAGAP